MGAQHVKCDMASQHFASVLSSARYIGGKLLTVTKTLFIVPL